MFDGVPSSMIKQVSAGYRINIKTICYADDATPLTEYENSLPRLLLGFAKTVAKYNIILYTKNNQTHCSIKEPILCNWQSGVNRANVKVDSPFSHRYEVHKFNIRCEEEQFEGIDKVPLGTAEAKTLRAIKSYVN